MAFAVLTIVLLFGAYLLLRPVSPSTSYHLMPPDDRPPLEAFDPMPSGSRLTPYIAHGLAEIDDFLTGRDQTA